MASSPITARIHNNMNLTEIENAQNNIKDLDDKKILISRGEKFGTLDVVYFKNKSTISERSLIKLSKLKNTILRKTFSSNENLTKNITDLKLISVKDLKNFLNERITTINNSKDKDLEDDSKMKINQDLKSTSEINLQNQEKNSQEPKGTIQDNELLRMLEVIEDDKKSVQDFQSEFQKQTQNINPKSIAGTTIDTELKKLEDEFDLHDIRLDDLNNKEKITEQTQKKNPHEKGITPQILDDEPMLMGISDENELISHSAVEITTSDIGPPPPTYDIGPPPPTDDPGTPPTKVDPDLVKRRELLNLLKDMGLR